MRDTVSNEIVLNFNCYWCTCNSNCWLFNLQAIIFFI